MKPYSELVAQHGADVAMLLCGLENGLPAIRANTRRELEWQRRPDTHEDETD